MINGIDYLKKMYPDRDDKDYQPSGLDLRVGKVYSLYNTWSDEPNGLWRGEKHLPSHQEIEPKHFGYLMNRYHDNDKYTDIYGWKIVPNYPYIFEVDRQIEIGQNNAQFYLPRSTLLRAGVNVYTALGDLGYNGHLSFLVINHYDSPFFIEKGERFAQLIDFEVKGGSESYDGDYQEKPGRIDCTSTLGFNR